MFRAQTSLRLRRACAWGMVVVILALSLIGALAATHQALHAVDGSTSMTHEAGPVGDNDHPPTPMDSSSLDEVLHGLAHATKCCGFTMAVLPTPVAKLLSPPPPLIPAFYARPAPAPLLQGLFRPPIR